MVSPTSGKPPSSDDDKYSKIKRSLAEDDPDKKHLMLVEGILDLLVLNDINHAKMMESIDYLHDEMRKQFEAVFSELESLRKYGDALFKEQESMHKRFDAILVILDGLGASVGAGNKRLDLVFKELGAITKIITSHNEYFEAINGRFASIDKKFAEHDAKLDEILRLLREQG